MMKNKLYIAIAAISLVFLNGCFDDPGTNVLFDTSFVELDAATTTSGDRTYLYERLNDGTTYDAGFLVVFSGAANANGVNITFAIDTASTAIENVHYTVQATSVTIPAGEWSAELPLTILADNIEAGEKLSIIINITDSDATINPNFSTATHIIQITCPSDIALGAYAETLTGTGAGVPVELTKNTDGSYTLSQMNFDYYNPGYDPIPGTFVDICGELTLQGAPTDVFGIAWIGSGSYDPDTGNLSFSVSDATYNPDYVVDMVFEKQ